MLPAIQTPYEPEVRYMERALELAELAAAEGEVPVGAVVVHKPTGAIIGEGYNRREAAKSPLSHAEILAIRQSAIYVTLEPCPMCAGAILHARLDQVIFGTRDPKGGAVCSVEQMFELPYNWKPQVMEGMLQPACAAVLQDFFRQLRQKKKAADSAAEKR